jgi:galactonate dehydratase
MPLGHAGQGIWRELLGGQLRDRIRNYANINRSTEERTPAGFAAMAEKAVAA